MNTDLRTTEIIERLEVLTLEANTLVKELRQIKRQEQEQEQEQDSNNQTAPPTNPKRNQYKIGDQVTIVNNYRGKKGTNGTVSHTTRTTVTLIDRTGKTYTRRHTNVTRTAQS